MKTLWSSSSKLFSGGNNGNRGGFFSAKDVHVLGRSAVHFLGNQKHVNVDLISLQHKKMMMTMTMTMIRPVLSSSSPTHCSLSSESQVELEAAETRTQGIHPSKTVHVKLQLQKECLFGEKFLIVGDDPVFGLWDPSDAIPLDWSEEHLWTVELDIPIGRTIQFKFILKGSTGNIVWQPGPDRILRTWETKKTITVLEDWENAEFQKITEEGPIQTNNGVFIVNSSMLILDENLTLPKEEQMDDVNKTSETYNELIVAQNITQSSMPMVAENITYPHKNDDTTIAQNEEILVNCEACPVLVPGLTPLSALQTEEDPLDQDERSITMDSSVGPGEAKNWNASECNEKREPDSGLLQVVMKMMFKREEMHTSELQQNPDLGVKEQLQSDMQWGRETLQKLLSNLGLF